METTYQELYFVPFKDTAVVAALYSSKERALPGAQKYYSGESKLGSRHFTSYFCPLE